MRLVGLAAAARPFVDRDPYTWRLGVDFYRFGARGENRSLTVHLGHRALCWEWSR